MEKNLSNEHNVHATNLVKQKISTLCLNNFLWREIATLTGIPKKLIKGIAKGKYILEEQEATRLQNVFDELLEKLKIDKDGEINEPSFESSAYTKILLNVKDVVLHKGTDDNSLVLLIKGEKIVSSL